MDLEPFDLARLQSIVQQSRPLSTGSHLYRVGDPFTAIYAVRSGCIKSYSIDAGGHELVHAFHLRGEPLGFDAVHPERHRCNAVILEPSSVCVVPYRDIARLSSEFHYLRSEVLRLVSREFSRQLMCGEGSGATQRIAAFLMDMRARLQQSSRDDREIRLPMSREDISSYLRISPETLSRLLTKLHNRGLIDIDRRRILVGDPIHLDLIAQGLN